jgi:hypothetical protein
MPTNTKYPRWWIGLDWIGLDWIGLDWIGLDWIGLDWIGLGLEPLWLVQVIEQLQYISQHIPSDTALQVDERRCDVGITNELDIGGSSNLDISGNRHGSDVAIEDNCSRTVRNANTAGSRQGHVGSGGNRSSSTLSIESHVEGAEINDISALHTNGTEERLHQQILLQFRT